MASSLSWTRLSRRVQDDDDSIGSVDFSRRPPSCGHLATHVVTTHCSPSPMRPGVSLVRSLGLDLSRSFPGPGKAAGQQALLPRRGDARPTDMGLGTWECSARIERPGRAKREASSAPCSGPHLGPKPRPAITDQICIPKVAAAMARFPVGLRLAMMGHGLGAGRDSGQRYETLVNAFHCAGIRPLGMGTAAGVRGPNTSASTAHEVEDLHQ